MLSRPAANLFWIARYMERAEKRGIYVLLCFENAHDVKEMKSPYWRSAKST